MSDPEIEKIEEKEKEPEPEPEPEAKVEAETETEEKKTLETELELSDEDDKLEEILTGNLNQYDKEMKYHVWEGNWDDDDVEDDFNVQLKTQLDNLVMET